MSRARSLAALLVLAVAGVLVTVSGPLRLGAQSQDPRPAVAGGRLPIQGEGGIAASEQDFTGELVPVLERDSILALEQPPIVAAVDLERTEPIVGVVVGAVARAYPLRVLAAHEVVNDTLGGVPIVVTYCPLCATAVAYNRRVHGQARQFGVSGYLLNSSLVMFDRETETLWSQVTGAAVAGNDEGATLARIPAVKTDLASWLVAYPGAGIVDIEALGGDARYPRTRFAQYAGSTTAGLVPLAVRADLPEKALVAGVRVGHEARAYPFAGEQAFVVNDRLGTTNLILWVDGATASATAFLRSADQVFDFAETGAGRAELVDRLTGERWRALDGRSLDGGVDLSTVEVTVVYWFGWAAFFPATTVWSAAS